MDASIGEHNIKTFVRILQCGSKFGDELCIHANKDVWEMAVTNSSRSAFFLAKLRPHNNARTGEPGFFSQYKPMGSISRQRKGVKCMLLVRTVLAVLQKASTSSNVKRLDLKIIAPEPAGRNRHSSNTTQEDGDEEEDDGLTHRLEVKLVCEHGVTKRHSLNLGSAEFLRADVDPSSTPSSFTLPAKTLRDWLDHFSLSTGPVSSASAAGSTGGGSSRGETQLSWHFGKHEVRIKSWEGWTRELTTEIKVDIGEFGQYWLEDGEVEFTLPMREFRGMLQLAESLAIDVSGAFSGAGQPLTLTSDPDNSESEPFDIFCAIATTISDAFTAEEGANIAAAAAAAPAASGPRRAESERPDKRARSESTSNGRSASERPDIIRPRQSSAAPPSRKVSRLGFSAEVSQPSGGILRASLQPQARREEALFLPSGSQEEEEAEAAEMSASQAAMAGQRLTQQQIADMSGLGDLNQLADDLDQEEEEELRASQQVHQAPGFPDYADETAETEPLYQGYNQGGRSMFEGDGTDLFPEIRDTTRLGRRSRSRSAGRDKSRSPRKAAASGSDEELNEDDEMPPTQYKSRPNTFRALLED